MKRTFVHLQKGHHPLVSLCKVSSGVRLSLISSSWSEVIESKSFDRSSHDGILVFNTSCCVVSNVSTVDVKNAVLDDRFILCDRGKKLKQVVSRSFIKKMSPTLLKCIIYCEH